MNEYRIEARLSDMEKGISELGRGVVTITEKIAFTDTVWDNADLIRNWHVSARTLAAWRASNKISFSQVGKKIYYSKKDRDCFMEKYHVKNVNRDERGERI